MCTNVRTLLTLVIVLSATTSTIMARERALESIDRRIGGEPQYTGQPQYLLLALGPEAQTLVWVVEDGRTLYVDKNANGDLTDDGPPIVPTDERSFQIVREDDSTAASWDFNYLLAEFATLGRPTQKDFNMRRWNYGSSDDSYGLSLTLDGGVPMYAGWFGSFWGASPEEASILHFGGPLTPRMLRYKDFTLGSGLRRLSIGFMNPGLGDGADTRLSIDAPADDVIPVLHIRWPTADSGPPLQTTHQLTERCCYWEFYTTDFEVPAEATVGTATVSVELPEGAVSIPLTTSEIEVPVVAAAAGSQPGE
jgi:hypothetical protein